MTEITVGNFIYVLNTIAKTAGVKCVNTSISGDIVIPESLVHEDETYTVTSITITGFINCASITSVIMPNTITIIGDAGFQNCSGLTSITLSNTLTTIGNLVFRSCVNLLSLVIPNSVTSIGAHVCRNNTKLGSVTLPNAITAIPFEMFGYCYGLKSIVIPSSVTIINSNAFMVCGGLTSVTIPSSVTTIGSNAFFQCTSLPSIIIPDSVTIIQASAFANCTSLINITFQNIKGITTISTNSFTDRSTIPSSSIHFPNVNNEQALQNIITSGSLGAVWNTIIAYYANTTYQIPTIASSVDGIIWTGQGNPFSTSCNAMFWAGDKWIATGDGDDNILFSYDGAHWFRSIHDPFSTGHVVSGNNRLSAAPVSSQLFVPAGQALTVCAPEYLNESAFGNTQISFLPTLPPSLP